MAQFPSPIVWLLAVAALLSFLLDSPTDGAIGLVWQVRSSLPTNLLTDLPQIPIADDRVKQDWLVRPHRWSLPFIL